MALITSESTASTGRAGSRGAAVRDHGGAGPVWLSRRGALLPYLLGAAFQKVGGVVARVDLLLQHKGYCNIDDFCIMMALITSD